MSDQTHLIVVAPRAHEAKLRQAGFQLAGRMNAHTITLYRTYTDLGFAMIDAKTLPPHWVWATEPVTPRH